LVERERCVNIFDQSVHLHLPSVLCNGDLTH
jgi:hypothetical protein